MRKKILAAAFTAALAVSIPGTALAGPGKAIQDACDASFGQLISAGKSSGEAAHQNYKGGARAFSDPAILAAHGCTP